MGREAGCCVPSRPGVSETQIGQRSDSSPQDTPHPLSLESGPGVIQFRDSGNGANTSGGLLPIARKQ